MNIHIHEATYTSCSKAAAGRAAACTAMQASFDTTRIRPRRLVSHRPSLVMQE